MKFEYIQHIRKVQIKLFIFFRMCALVIIRLFSLHLEAILMKYRALLKNIIFCKNLVAIAVDECHIIRKWYVFFYILYISYTLKEESFAEESFAIFGTICENVFPRNISYLSITKVYSHEKIRALDS